MLALRVQVDVDIATHIDVYDDGPDRRYAYLSYCFTGFVMQGDTLVCALMIKGRRSCDTRLLIFWII